MFAGRHTRHFQGNGIAALIFEVGLAQIRINFLPAPIEILRADMEG